MSLIKVSRFRTKTAEELAIEAKERLEVVAYLRYYFCMVNILNMTSKELEKARLSRMKMGSDSMGFVQAMREETLIQILNAFVATTGMISMKSIRL